MPCSHMMGLGTRFPPSSRVGQPTCTYSQWKMINAKNVFSRDEVQSIDITLRAFIFLYK